MSNLREYSPMKQNQLHKILRQRKIAGCSVHFSDIGFDIVNQFDGIKWNGQKI